MDRREEVECSACSMLRLRVKQVLHPGSQIGCMDGRLECQSYGNGTHLASILNAKEASVIAKYISGFQRNQPVWIGLRDLQKNQRWQWIDGTTYVNGSWAGQPQGENKHCAEVNHRNRFLTWNSNECSLRQHFLCKYQP
ncbi:regenerating islet-derived protein 4 isoform X2 [Lepus europaeus]|uniref:regenerating islet-derived protein 4 isoform X2 n=1 Tax=Lepus europaeus TaxID=9983 RepID=UPI002B49886C|nr:regenerating islet-derived protein 4 isoform X2 [Lepus europaeus]